MGWVSLWTNEFFLRFLMFFRQPSKYPKCPQTEYVEHSKMHLFTLIQIVLFGGMYAIKSIKSIALLFPIILALCIPIRSFILPRIFDEKSLVFLDGEDEDINNILDCPTSPTDNGDGFSNVANLKATTNLKPTTLGHAFPDDKQLGDDGIQRHRTTSDVEHAVVNDPQIGDDGVRKQRTTSNVEHAE